ncbi:hypothetical protein GWK47_017728 [Chionoecetes opilio]|uniref:Uncharacterized protein n=1 Tax=Chionoecetes opilio TaxID=41210 RepID=A0A8J4XR37_CHIOP|nr:hypothetical protein GWK47_017728 [Chionoecetes opilio]
MNGEAGSGGGGGAGMFETLSTKLQEQYQTVSATYANTKPLQLPLQGPDVPRVYGYVGGPYMPLILRHAHVLCRVHAYARDPAGPDKWQSETLKQARDETDSLLSSHQQQIENLHTTPPHIPPGANPPCLSRLHHLTQSVGVVCMLSAVVWGC